MTDDEKVAQQVSQKYRELGREEPPGALDDAILAAARRSVRPWSQRWAVPFSIAAVLVLSVAVTLRIQHEQSGIESPVPQAKQKETAPAPAAPAPVAEARPRAMAIPQKPRPAVRKEPEPFANAVQDKVAADQPPAAAAAPAPATQESLASRRDAGRSAESSAAGAIARNQAAPAAKAALADTPERELERIAGLRHLGMHDEADKALAEFRKRYPDYVIAEAMRARVERR